MYKYVVGKCYWNPRETADAKHDLCVAEVAMFEDAKDIACHNWPAITDGTYHEIEIKMDLNDLNSLSIAQVSGCIPGDLFRDGYTLIGKLEKARNTIVSKALAILMKQAQERMPF